eukprot:354212-Chlamydomonas_euryale.AAC.9
MKPRLHLLNFQACKPLALGLGVSGAVLVGTSMGCAVIWSMHEIFGLRRSGLARGCVFVDQAPLQNKVRVGDAQAIAHAPNHRCMPAVTHRCTLSGPEGGRLAARQQGLLRRGVAAEPAGDAGARTGGGRGRQQCRMPVQAGAAGRAGGVAGGNTAVQRSAAGQADGGPYSGGCRG